MLTTDKKKPHYKARITSLHDLNLDMDCISSIAECGHRFHALCAIVGLRIARFKYVSQYLNFFFSPSCNTGPFPSSIQIGINWLVSRKEIWSKHCLAYRAIRSDSEDQKNALQCLNDICDSHALTVDELFYYG